MRTSEQARERRNPTESYVSWRDPNRGRGQDPCCAGRACAIRPPASSFFLQGMSGGGQMLNPRVIESAGADPGLHDTGRAMVCVDVLYKFPELVAQLGGDTARPPS